MIIFELIIDLKSGLLRTEGIEFLNITGNSLRIFRAFNVVLDFDTCILKI